MKKENKKFERINEKTNLRNFLPRLFWRLINLWKYESIYFFDTNFVVSNQSSKDKRIKKLFTINSNYYLSETIKCESDNHLNNKENDFFCNINKKFQVISINNLKEKFSEACPLYYNYILSCHNPAIINNPSFWSENFLSQLIKKTPQNKKNARDWNSLVDNIYKSKNRKENLFGDKPTMEEYIIDDAFHRGVKKKRKSINSNNDNYLNDHKNLATAFLYCLLNKKNVSLVTADYDIIYYFLLLIDNLVQQMVFTKLILEYKEKITNFSQRFWNGETFIFHLKKEEFDEWENNLRADIIAHDWKKEGFRFTIKFWHVEKQKYYIPIWLNFSEKNLDLILNTHGGVTCPFVRNDNYGNWFTFRYFWPPSTANEIKNNLIRIELKKKENIYRKTIKVPWPIHNNQCYYSSIDQSGELTTKSGFSEHIDPTLGHDTNSP